VPAGTADPELRNQDWYRDEQYAAEIDEYERAAAADAYDVRKLPDVAQPDGCANGCKNKSKP
jgi:hypothetical protein